MKFSNVLSLALLSIAAQGAVLPGTDEADAPEVDVIAVAQRDISESDVPKIDVVAVAQRDVSQEQEVDIEKRGFGIVADILFVTEMFTLHNLKRLRHGVPLLNWDSGCYKHAQNLADSYDCSGNFPDPGNEYGNNQGTGNSNPVTVVADSAVVVDSWYAPSTSYNYGNPTAMNSFTNLVWKSTTKVGCAYKDCRSKKRGYYYTCSYDPAGNVPNFGKQNIFPPK
ncbi:uncharacterized protein SPAPADRAFT_148416 [Spathaspora passalidarum NRRL Y-27907]|uniref:SCP domain-containing protein n=1 Tax=Spathaspora passalidarum (strain NRRL Y-27907 / 11-Y1) TaxID=619300 RepID=G3AJZ9_SPAPN|nr:uncharacterized protein SPAPADRAFT_148416 [Spathaspora passalidarum NRRL Y-27907]EGW34050.1 hypothetical protein SPAPADRAFT_148416 [Spathaspora passalidarum NRRL Y-27907]